MSKLTKQQLDRTAFSLDLIKREKLQKIKESKYPSLDFAINEARKKTTIFTTRVLNAYNSKKGGSYVDISIILQDMPEYASKLKNHYKEKAENEQTGQEIGKILDAEIHRIMNLLYLGEGNALELIEEFKTFNPKVK